MNENKSMLANTLADLGFDGGHPPMTDCERYGMTWGCDKDCPVLNAGLCEEKFGESKELYYELLQDLEANDMLNEINDKDLEFLKKEKNENSI